MRVLMIHNAYQQQGGEDTVFQTEQKLLASRGHAVTNFVMSNHDIPNINKVRLARETVWSSRSKRSLRIRLREDRPDVSHVHNTFPLISPSAHYAAYAEGVPVVQTLHNYRLLCPNALLFRDRHACEDCMGRFVPWPGMMHACYRGNRAASAVVAAMLTSHRALHTWTEKVDVYVALTEFARQKFVEGGLPAEKVVVKPNFVHPDPGAGEGKGDYILFVGRLSVERGIDILLSAWERIGKTVPLKIVGEGPLANEVAQASKKIKGVEWLGRRSREQVLTLMKEARLLVFPSKWYEGFPTVIGEAYAAGLPVLAANLGSMTSLIDHGRTGLRFRAGDVKDLASQVEWVLAHTRQLAAMRREARAEFEAKYTADRNYRMLMEIYELAIERATSRPGPVEVRP
jgi:glycosyltransferase involved in cell wall biosynthesis